MRTKTDTILLATVCYLATALVGLSATNAPAPAPAPAPKLTGSQPKPGRFYADTFLSLATQDFNSTEDGYGVGVGYQVSPHWAVESRIRHVGLDFESLAVQDIGCRIVARMPFDFLSPYTFLGTSYNLSRDDWAFEPGAGVEIGVNKRLKGLSVFAEGGLIANLKGDGGYLFSSGLRWRF
jgi:hypothetical protein